MWQRVRLITLSLIAVVGISAVAHAFVANSANIAKENGYVVLIPPSSSALIAKQNGYVVLQPPGDALVAKENGYVVLQPPPDVLIAKEVAYVVVTKAYPSVQILQ